MSRFTNQRAQERINKLKEVGSGNSAFKDYYTDGHGIRRRLTKVGRNDPCPCGSLKKYKRCCGR